MPHGLKAIALFLIGLNLSTVALAQEGRMESVVVTASYIDDDNRRGTPPNIYKSVPADFILTQLTCSSGTRDAVERKAELSSVFEEVTRTVRETPGFDLAAGEANGALAPIETVRFSDVYASSSYDQRGRFDLVLMTDRKDERTFEGLFKRAEDFVDDLEMSGRAECFLDDEQFLGLRDASKHRADIISEIADEVRRLKEMFAPARITITGLEGQVVSQPSGPLELQLFVPYSLSLQSGDDD